MIDKNLFTPLFKVLDKVILGLDEPHQNHKRNEFIEIDNEEEFDVTRSIN